MNAVVCYETPVGACTRDPERWTTTADSEAKAICRACPRRWLCAREACELPKAEGVRLIRGPLAVDFEGTAASGHRR